jgi:hypothetical protein
MTIVEMLRTWGAAVLRPHIGKNVRAELGGDSDWGSVVLALNPAIWEAIAGTGYLPTTRSAPSW